MATTSQPGRGYAGRGMRCGGGDDAELLLHRRRLVSERSDGALLRVGNNAPACSTPAPTPGLPPHNLRDYARG
eukprot:gene2400-20321_t